MCSHVFISLRARDWVIKGKKAGAVGEWQDINPLDGEPHEKQDSHVHTFYLQKRQISVMDTQFFLYYFN